MKQRTPLRDSLAVGVRLAWDASPRALIAIALLSVFTSMLLPLVILLGKHLVDLVVIGERQRLALADMIPTIVAFGVLGGLERALTTIRFNAQEVFSRRVEHRAMRRFIEKAAEVDLGHFDNSDWHDRMARARRDIGWRPFQLTITTIGLVGNCVGIIGMLGMLASLRPLLVVLSVVSVLPGVALQRRIARRIYEFQFDTTPEDRERWYMVDLLAGADGAKELRAFGLAQHFIRRHDRITDDNLNELSRLYRRANWAFAASGLGSGVAIAIAYGFAAASGVRGELTAGDLTAVIGAFAALTGQASLMSNALLQIEQHAAFLNDLFSFLEVEPLLPMHPLPERLPAQLDGVVLRDVHFTYPRSTKLVLAGIDLEVKPGELVALVGENGAGKTTLVSLLTRFYDPTAGEIRIGGVDLRNVDPVELRGRIGVLFQNFGRYQLTLRENVQLGRIDCISPDEELLAALEAGRARQLIDALKPGLNARLGRLFDGGYELSGGEWQRVAVSRLMHRRADLWILDEPTASLDPAAEAEVFAELKQQLAGRMAIVISHRFSTVRNADRIYVLEHGRVLESGTHDQLVAASGRYAELFELQAAGYR